MKGLLKFIPMAFLAFGLVSCGGDDDVIEEILEMDTIQGEWTAISFSADINSETQLPGGQSSITEGTITGSDLDYDLVLAEDSWTTEGSYTTNSNLTVGGMSISTGDIALSDVQGSGDYSLNGEEITIEGSMFDVNIDGIASTSTDEGTQTASYSINENGVLSFTQEQVMEIEEFDIVTKTTISSISTWERK